MSQVEKQIEPNKIRTLLEGIMQFIEGIGVFVQGFTTENGIDEVVSTSELPPETKYIKDLAKEVGTAKISMKDEKEIDQFKLSENKLSPRKNASKSIVDNEISNEKTRE